MAVFASDKPTKTLEDEAEMNPNSETSINPFNSSSSSSSSSDWYLGSDSMSWSGSYGSDDELGRFDWVNVISDWVFSDSSDEEFPVNIASIPVGFVLSVKGRKVIVEGKEEHNVLKGSFLWVTETRAPLGCVDKIFGTVKKPCFRVKIKSESQVPQGIGEGTEVSLLVEDFVPQDKNGCVDGGRIDEIVFSDDEKEADCKKMQNKKMEKEVLGLERSEELTVQVPKGISQGTQVSLGDFIQQNKKGCVDALSSRVKIDEIKFSDDVKEADCKKVQNKKMEKEVLGSEKSEEQTVLSPNRSDSEISPVKSQAIAETGGLVPNRPDGKKLQIKKMEKNVLGLERSDSEISPVKSQAIAETSGLVPQEQPLPRMGKFAAPRRSESTNQPKPYQPPMANQMGGITAKPVLSQAPVWTRPTPNPTTYTQPRFRKGQNHNNQQPFRGDMYKPHQNPAPWPRANSNRIHPQTQQPMQSQSLNAKPSSDQGRGMLAYHRGVGEGRGFGLGRGRVLKDQA